VLMVMAVGGRGDVAAERETGRGGGGGGRGAIGWAGVAAEAEVVWRRSIDGVIATEGIRGGLAGVGAGAGAEVIAKKGGRGEEGARGRRVQDQRRRVISKRDQQHLHLLQ
jgi:hypothetical protein